MKKNPIFSEVRKKNLSLVITFCHRSASLMMAIDDIRMDFSIPPTLMMDSYNPHLSQHYVKKLLIYIQLEHDHVEIPLIFAYDFSHLLF